MRTLLPLLLFTSIFANAQKLTIHFYFNKSNITEQAAMQLDSFIAANKIYNNTISLFGHTDSKGSNKYNYALSLQRVDAVKKYLISNGMNEKYLKQAAFGKTKLIQPIDTDTAVGEINRRVEIIVVNKKIDTIIKNRLTKKEQTIKEIIEDTAIKKGSMLVLKNMQFEGGRHKLLPTSLPQLQNLLAALQNNNRLQISIEGHICCLPGNVDGEDFDTGTQDLSMQRAKAIYEYLVLAGIAENRLQYKGYGHRFPIKAFPENNEEEKTMNRRVEIKILDK